MSTTHRQEKGLENFPDPDVTNVPLVLGNSIPVIDLSDNSFRKRRRDPSDRDPEANAEIPIDTSEEAPTSKRQRISPASTSVAYELP